MIKNEKTQHHLQSNILQIPWNDLNIGQLVGHGGYGEVYSGSWFGTDVAVKQLHLKSLPDHLIQDFINETQLMAQCSFPHIVRLYGVCLEIGHYSMVMEYMIKGSLYQLLQNKNMELPWMQRVEIALDIGKGLSFLHNQNILHRDLKSLNVLLDENYRAKISDFGLAKLKIESGKTSTSHPGKVIGTTCWLAPELVSLEDEANSPTKASDVYGYGMVMWEIASRELPYKNAKNEAVASMWIMQGKKEKIPLDCPVEYGKIIIKTWGLPQDRPTAKEVTQELEKLRKTELHSKPAPKPYTPKSWHFDPQTKQSAKLEGQNYVLLSATNVDVEKVVRFYQHRPVPGYEIGEVKVIYNPGFNRGFEIHLQKLQQRHNNPGFTPKWSEMSNASLRKETYDLFIQLTTPYTDPDYPDVKLFPAWHGTKPQVLSSLFSTGYANLATTDTGFFGKGYYSSYEAEYSYRVYSQGALILNWTACYSPFPVVGDDMDKLALAGKNNYSNYDAHFVPVRPKYPDNPYETFYYPCDSLYDKEYIEIVTFDSAAILPRYLVELQAVILKSPPVSLPTPTESEKIESEKTESPINPLIIDPPVFPEREELKVLINPLTVKPSPSLENIISDIPNKPVLDADAVVDTGENGKKSDANVKSSFHFPKFLAKQDIDVDIKKPDVGLDVDADGKHKLKKPYVDIDADGKSKIKKPDVDIDVDTDGKSKIKKPDVDTDVDEGKGKFKLKMLLPNFHIGGKPDVDTDVEPVGKPKKPDIDIDVDTDWKGKLKKPISSSTEKPDVDIDVDVDGKGKLKKPISSSTEKLPKSRKSLWEWISTIGEREKKKR